ncbi:MAG: ATP-binding protein [Acetobacterium sp.]|nr:ATP-binding protein [Acetobacterium sp.]
MDSIKLTLPTKPEYVSLARLTIASVANNMGFSIGDVEDLKVAVSEACTNALNHSKNPDTTYDLTYVVENQKLVFTVTDRGVGFEPENVAMPDLNGKQLGGFGLFIIKSLMDRVEIISEQGLGTTITMIKNLSTTHEV